MSVAFREIEHGSAEYAAACTLRNELLRRPLGMDLFDEDLDTEAAFVHVGGFDDDDELVAYLQFTPLGRDVLKMQQVVVLEALQGRGVGRELVEFAERLVGNMELVLHAREAVTGFYEELGYRREGKRFVEISLPHWKMRKSQQRT